MQKCVLHRFRPEWVMGPSSFVFLSFLAVEENPFMGELQDFGGEGQIIATESRRFLPHVSIFKQSTYGNLMAKAKFCFVSPNRCFDKTHSNSMDRWATHSFTFLACGTSELMCKFNVLRLEKGETSTSKNACSWTPQNLCLRYQQTWRRLLHKSLGGHPQRATSEKNYVPCSEHKADATVTKLRVLS